MNCAGDSVVEWKVRRKQNLSKVVANLAIDRMFVEENPGHGSRAKKVSTKSVAIKLVTEKQMISNVAVRIANLSRVRKSVSFSRLSQCPALLFGQLLWTADGC